jgi:hypothetical protein
MRVRCIHRGSWRSAFTKKVEPGPEYGTEWNVIETDDIFGDKYYTLAEWRSDVPKLPDAFLAKYFVPITNIPDVDTSTDLRVDELEMA